MFIYLMNNIINTTINFFNRSVFDTSLSIFPTKSYTKSSNT